MSSDLNPKAPPVGPASKDAGVTSDGKPLEALTPARSGLAWLALLLAILNLGLLVGFFAFSRNQGLAGDNARVTAEQKLTGLVRRVEVLELAANQRNADNASLANRIAALEALPKTATLPTPATDPAPGLDALATRIAALETKPPPAPDTAALGAIEQRISALEAVRLSTAAEITAKFDGITKDIQDNVKPQLAALAQAAPQLTTKADLQPVIGRLSALEAGDDRKTARAASAALAIDVLLANVRTGAPFGNEFATVRRLVGAQTIPPPALDMLSRYANTGIPTLESLLAELPATVKTLREADQHRDAGLAGTLRRTFGDVVTIHTQNSSADNAIDALSRALKRDDLSQTMAAAAELDPKSRAAIEPWLDRVKIRQSGLSAVESLRANAMRDLAAAATPPQ